MQRYHRLLCAATAPPAASASPVHDAAARHAALFSLYRRLLKAGEDGEMMQHCVSVHGLDDSVKYGVRLLRLHRGLTTVDAAARRTRWFHFIRRTRQELARRYYAWSIFYLRLKLRSWNAISDMLVYVLFLTVCVLLYEIYHTCRVGVNRAEERYRTLAIPIMQTFDALEAAPERKTMLRKEMEEDIVRDR